MGKGKDFLRASKKFRNFTVNSNHCRGNTRYNSMNEEDTKRLAKDTDGLLTYEYIANHIGEDDLDIDQLVDNMMKVDQSGQFTVSAARYLAAIDAKTFAPEISRLVAAAIDKDRERRYIGELLPSLWGEDYRDHAEELSRSDNNFRRIYKRIHANQPI